MKRLCRFKTWCAIGCLALTASAQDSQTVFPESLRVASIQMEVTENLATNLTRIERGIHEAADAKARIAIFPETALSGFTEQAVTGIDWNKLREAESKLRALAAERNIYILFGSITPSGKDRPYNSAVLIDPDGNEVTRYHKMGPEPWFAPGDHLALFEIDGVPATVMICHDERYPEVTRLPVLAGARICFYISYEINSLPGALRKADGYRAQLVARAAENGIWVCQSNAIGPLGDGDRLSLGQSRMVNPGGDVVVEAPALVDTMLMYDITPNSARRGNALESLELNGIGEWMQAGLKLVRSTIATDESATLQTAATPPRDQVRLALMQTVPEKWALEENFAVFEEAIAVAARENAEIFITPECWLDGYAAPDEASTIEKLRTVAQPLEGSPYLDRVADLAREHSMFICFGFTSLIDGQIYNSAGLWNDKGERIGIYHKTHLQTHDLQYAAGESLPVWDSPWGKLGVMICADRRWPETTRTLRLQGARLILNPTYGMHHEKNEWWMRTRSYENQCYIAFAHPNVGFITNPRGDVTAKRDENPGVLIADIDLSQARDDNHLRDRRPELYRAITETR